MSYDYAGPVREAIERDDAKFLDRWVTTGETLDRFPGDWQGSASITPIAYAVQCRSETAFIYLLDIPVDLKVRFVVEKEDYELSENDEDGDEEPGEEFDVLSYAYSLMRKPGGRRYIFYVNVLTSECVNEIDEILARRTELRSDPVVLQQCNTRLRNIVPRLAEMLKMELPASTRRQNFVGRAILKLMDAGVDLNIDLFDLSRLFYDETTERIYERLQNDRNERNLILASSQHNNGQSRLAALSVDLLRQLGALSLAENLRGLRLGECCVCFQQLDLHRVCENGHELCGRCRTHMNANNRFNCPMCRTRMYGT